MHIKKPLASKKDKNKILSSTNKPEKTMSYRYKIHDQHGLNFITLTVVGWIDIFTRKKYRDLIVENLIYCKKNKGLRIHGYVIMTNHIHLVVSTDGTHLLSSILRDFESYTAKLILNDVQESALESRKSWLTHLFKYLARRNKRDSERQFWQGNNHPMSLESVKFIRQKLEYIHNNPVRAGWVAMPQYFIYSSASNYLENGMGVLEVDILDEYYHFG
jgi:putative transposase